MTEQQHAQELGRLIDGLQNGSSDSLPAEEMAFAAQLLAVRDQTRADEGFAAALEAQLQAAPRSTFTHQPSPLNRGASMMTHRQHRSFRTLATVAAVLAIAAFATLTVPPLRTLAQEVFNLLFQRMSSDVVAFETPYVIDTQPTPVAPPPVTVPVSEQLQNAISKAGFPVRLPAYVPEGYVLTDADYDPVANQVSLFYVRDGIGLVLVQMPDESALPMDIGATAEVVTVSIGDATGQYVEGGWYVKPSVSGDTAILTEKTWDADFPFQQLRWQEGDMVYWIMTAIPQQSDLSLEQWVQIGESLQ